MTDRRSFIQTTVVGSAGLLTQNVLGMSSPRRKPVVAMHVWVYSADMPKFDCMPRIDQIFADVKYAGIEAVELMDVSLRQAGAVDKIGEAMARTGIPVLGASYDQPMWDKRKQAQILEDAELVVGRLAKLKGRLLGISVGNAGREKTGDELDTQADTLRNIQSMCRRYNVVPNLHNHTYEVADDLYDLTGSLERVPDIALGPDLDWLFQAKVDPITFLDKYGSKVVYTHLRDHRWTGTWTEALGEGMMDFKAIAHKFKQVNFQGDIGIELAFPAGFKPTRPIRDSLKMSRAVIQKAFGV
jgi:sugar phosphate isomerase/epimerase